MDNKQWKTGDVIWLKSGGPKMTVREKESDGEKIICDWFEGMTPKVGAYLPDQLTDQAPTSGNSANSSGRDFAGRGCGPSDRDFEGHGCGPSRRGFEGPARGPFSRDFEGRGCGGFGRGFEAPGRGGFGRGFDGRGHSPFGRGFDPCGSGPAVRDFTENQSFEPGAASFGIGFSDAARTQQPD